MPVTSIPAHGFHSWFDKDSRQIYSNWQTLSNGEMALRLMYEMSEERKSHKKSLLWEPFLGQLRNHGGAAGWERAR